MVRLQRPRYRGPGVAGAVGVSRNNVMAARGAWMPGVQRLERRAVNVVRRRNTRAQLEVLTRLSRE